MALKKMKKDLKKKCWINFQKFFEMLEDGKDFNAEDYSSKVMESNK